MSVSTWANAARQDKYRQTFEHQRAIDTIALLLERKLDPESAANTIATLYNPLLKNSPDISLIPTFWDIFCDAVKFSGDNKDTVDLQVDLINSISKLPDVKNEYGNTVAINGVFWRDLPEFAITFREYGIGASSIDHYIASEKIYQPFDRSLMMHVSGSTDLEPVNQTEKEGVEWDAQAASLLNATTFAATYLVRGTQPVGMPLHAEVGFRQGVEVPFETPTQRQNAIMYVPPAATWILIAGDAIYGLCKDNIDYKIVSPGSSEDSSEWLWSGQHWGFSLDRWAFWEERFGEIAVSQGLTDAVKDIAASANREMKKIDGEKKDIGG